MKERKASLEIPTLILYQVITIDFWLNWHFDVKGGWVCGWVGLELELSIVFIETV